MTQPEMFPGAVRRPDINDTAVRSRAIDALIVEIRGWNPTMSEQSEEDAREILGDSLHDNGFEIAKEFDRNGWEVDARLVELLDDAFSALHSALRKCVHEWVEATSPRPTLAVGAAVVTPD